MGSLYTCVNECFHGGILYRAGDTVNFEDESLLPHRKNGEIAHFQKIGDSVPVVENEEQSLFENLAKELGYTNRDIKGVKPGMGANGLPLEPYGPLHLLLEQHGATEPSKAIKVLEKVSSGQGVKTVRKSDFETNAEAALESLIKTKNRVELGEIAMKKGFKVTQKTTKTEIVAFLRGE